MAAAMLGDVSNFPKMKAREISKQARLFIF